MAFWGVEVKPGKPYSHVHDSGRGALRVSQATLGNGTALERSIVQCNIGNECPVLLCSLLPDRIESCCLDLHFEEEEDVVLSVVGPRSVHLTGYFLGVSVNNRADADNSDSYGEDIWEMGDEDSGSEDEDDYESDYIDDADIEMSPSHRPNSGVVIEEIVEHEKPYITVAEKHQIVVKSNKALLLESEDEDGFPISLCDKDNGENFGDKVSDAEKKRKLDAILSKKSEGNDKIGTINNGKLKKKKKDRVKLAKSSVTDNGISSGQLVDVPSGDVKKDSYGETCEAPSNEDNGKEDRDKGMAVEASGKLKKKREQFKREETSETRASLLDVIDENLDKSQQETASDKKNAKKKQKKNKKPPGGDSVGDKELEMGNEVPKKSRTFANGLVIEELSMGQPDGTRASPGKTVFVCYIGKLGNGKIFDSNVGQRPFKFRLGVGQVIKGWDVGVDGMRIGDKRRLTIPPSMGYGEKGAAGIIPGNSWLMFDVELVDVK